jgi:hypothetical protein
MHETKMYNVKVKFATEKEAVIMGIEGTDEDDVYNFIPCVIPSNVEYELISIDVDEGTTPDMERKKQARKNELQAKYQAILEEFTQICENLNDVEQKNGMAIVLDQTKDEFFICTLEQANQLDEKNHNIMIKAEPHDIERSRQIKAADERVNKGEMTDADVELFADEFSKYSESLDKDKNTPL